MNEEQAQMHRDVQYKHLGDSVNDFYEAMKYLKLSSEDDKRIKDLLDRVKQNTIRSERAIILYQLLTCTPEEVRQELAEDVRNFHTPD